MVVSHYCIFQESWRGDKNTNPISTLASVNMLLYILESILIPWSVVLSEKYLHTHGGQYKYQQTPTITTHKHSYNKRHGQF